MIFAEPPTSSSVGPNLSLMKVEVHRRQVMRKMQAQQLPDPVRLADTLSGST